jgi:hypothetical protein
VGVDPTLLVRPDRLRSSDILCCAEMATTTTAILDVYQFFVLYLIEIWMEQIVIFSVRHEIFLPIVCNFIVSFVVLNQISLMFFIENLSRIPFSHAFYTNFRICKRY